MSRLDPNWHQRITSAIRADPKRSGLLGVLTAVLIVVVGRNVLGPSAGPRRVDASASVTLSSPLMNRLSRSGSQTSAATSEWLQQPIKPLERNMFAIDFTRFPRDPQYVEPATQPVGGQIWDKLAKSIAARAEQLKERQNLAVNVRQEAAELHLQTTLMSAKPQAIIDGQLVGVGASIAGFKVLKIERRRVIVERAGILLAIQMQ